jgi:hypothetical protein
MSTSVTNRLSIIGNHKVKEFIKELNHQFIIDDDNDPGSETAVRRILYGYSNNFSEEIITSEKRKTVRFMNESHFRPLDSCITFVSISNIIPEIQDYIHIRLTALDPMVIVCNQYYNDSLMDCSTRYVVMNDLCIVQFSSTTPIAKPKIENDAFFKKADKLILKDKQIAFKKMKKEIKWITDEILGS